MWLIAQGWVRAPFWPTLRRVLLPPMAAAVALLVVPAAALRLLPLLVEHTGLPSAAAAAVAAHAWLAEAAIVAAVVAAVRARAALQRWVAQVHAERCAIALFSPISSSPCLCGLCWWRWGRGAVASARAALQCWVAQAHDGRFCTVTLGPCPWTALRPISFQAEGAVGWWLKCTPSSALWLWAVPKPSHS